MALKEEIKKRWLELLATREGVRIISEATEPTNDVIRELLMAGLRTTRSPVNLNLGRFRGSTFPSPPPSAFIPHHTQVVSDMYVTPVFSVPKKQT